MKYLRSSSVYLNASALSFAHAQACTKGRLSAGEAEALSSVTHNMMIIEVIALWEILKTLKLWQARLLCSEVKIFIRSEEEFFSHSSLKNLVSPRAILQVKFVQLS